LFTLIEKSRFKNGSLFLPALMTMNHFHEMKFKAF